tara:strand:+ start:533 stop:1018 length:486 start_codon:yes stop_codon:yes gene_type:complete
MPQERPWSFGEFPTPEEIRPDVGLGHLISFCYAEQADQMATDNSALLCPMVVQVRSEENINVPIKDMPTDYYTESIFAVGIIQAEDLRECASVWGVANYVRNAEAAEWGSPKTQESAMASMYVMVYNTATELNTETYKDYIQQDGFAKTMMFVRTDDFFNW